MPDKKGGGFAGLFIKPAPEEDGARPATPVPRSAAPQARIPDAPQGRDPETISVLVPGGEAVPARRRQPAPISTSAAPVAEEGPSEQVLALVEAVRKNVPSENATMQLMAAMKPLEAFVPDPAKRKEAALGVLAAQGITEKTVAAGTREVELSINETLDDLLAQADDRRKLNVIGKRADAEALRQQAAELTRQAADLGRQADTLDGEARVSDEQLANFTDDVEAARKVARETYGV